MNSRLLKFGVPVMVALFAVWLFFTPLSPAPSPSFAAKNG